MLTGNIYRLTGTSACQTLSSCAGAADEVKGTIAYDGNGNISSNSSGAGDLSLTASNAITYDGVGNLLTVDGPLAGTADTTRYRYDAARQVVGITSPDPDGAGPLKMRASRVTYRADGQVTRQEKGTVLSQSDADWANFVPSEVVDIAYDANSRAVTQKLSNAGTNYAMSQTSYDGLGRTDCVALRMNTAIYGSPRDCQKFRVRAGG